MKEEARGIPEVEALGRRWGITDDPEITVKRSQPGQICSEPTRSNNKRPHAQPPKFLSVDELLAMVEGTHHDAHPELGRGSRLTNPYPNQTDMLPTRRAQPAGGFFFGYAFTDDMLPWRWALLRWVFGL